jgi:hypothetical protein
MTYVKSRPVAVAVCDAPSSEPELRRRVPREWLVGKSAHVELCKLQAIDSRTEFVIQTFAARGESAPRSHSHEGRKELEWEVYFSRNETHPRVLPKSMLISHFFCPV